MILKKDIIIHRFGRISASISNQTAWPPPAYPSLMNPSVPIQLEHSVAQLYNKTTRVHGTASAAAAASAGEIFPRINRIHFGKRPRAIS